LEPLKLSHDIIHSESTILNFKHKGQQKVIKKLYFQDGEIFANKLYTLEMLASNIKYIPNYFLVPEALICVAGNIEGFSIPYMEGDNLEGLLKDESCSLEEKKYYLKKIGEILNQMKAIRDHTSLKDFFLCDLHASNFIVKRDNKEVGVVDLDSCKIKGNKSSFSRYLGDYSLLNYVEGKYKINKGNPNEIGHVTADENTDTYCYILTLLTFLYGNSNINMMSLEEFYNYLNYLTDIGVNRELIDSFATIVSNKNNTNPYYLVDSINNEQVCRAKKRVYEKVNKKLS
jgi:hypothetical protein